MNTEQHTERRLIAVSDEDVERLRLIYENEGNDLSPNDEALLARLWEDFEDGITEEEADALRNAWGIEEYPTDPRADALETAEAKLRSFTHPDNPGGSE